jgi:hypothetical protein
VETVACEKCNKQIAIGEYPYCPHGFGANSVTADDIPGGIEIRHGLCNSDGTPRRYYSKSEIDREAKKRGLVNRVEHIPVPGSGSDRSKHTSRWV